MREILSNEDYDSKPQHLTYMLENLHYSVRSGWNGNDVVYRLSFVEYCSSQKISFDYTFCRMNHFFHKFWCWGALHEADFRRKYDPKIEKALTRSKTLSLNGYNFLIYYFTIVTSRDDETLRMKAIIIAERVYECCAMRLSAVFFFFFAIILLWCARIRFELKQQWKRILF